MRLTLNAHETVRQAAARLRVDAGALAKAAGIKDVDARLPTALDVQLDKYVAGGGVGADDVDALKGRQPTDRTRSPLSVRTAQLEQAAEVLPETLRELWRAVDQNPTMGARLGARLGTPGAVLGLAIDLALLPASFALALAPKSTRAEERIANSGLTSVVRVVASSELVATMERFQRASPLGKAIIRALADEVLASTKVGPKAARQLAIVREQTDAVASPSDQAIARALASFFHHALSNVRYLTAYNAERALAAFEKLGAEEKKVVEPLLRELVLPDGKPLSIGSGKKTQTIPADGLAFILAALDKARDAPG